ncbi:MAG: hypothetical protein DI630_16810 [Gordonia sp. (in: high G+C Gram-positive bacteria)]|nr:MAG: hypothetical protein DI630_16810 [Gordonia sp. (in: high G+C Gram-positive bacteria)]
MPGKLRAVAPDEKAAPEQPKPLKSVTEAAESGTTRELLVAMRKRIAVAVEDPRTPARDLAALSRRLTEVVRDIEAIDAREADETDSEADAVDDTYDASAI